jgi:membrane protease YdiL (CAAX protease family)
MTHDSSTSTGWSAYHRATRSATYGFLSALPLLLAYEVLIVLANADAATPVRIGAEIWLKSLLSTFGAAGHLAVGAVVLAIGIAVFWAERHRNVPLRTGYFCGLVAESSAYAVLVAALVSRIVGLLFAAAPSPAVVGDVWTQLALSVGAGLYEELVFRVLLVGGLAWVFRQVADSATAAYVAAAVIGALLFSAVHYVGTFGDAFTLSSFTFRFLFGLALNALFLWRGFGVAAWTHALYDVFLVTSGL